MTSSDASESQALLQLLIQASESKRQAHYRAAIDVYQKALEQFGESVEVLAAIAYCYFAATFSPEGTDQDASESVAWMKRAIRLEPDNSRLYADLAEHLALATLDYAEAVKAYQRALELDPDNLRALVGAAARYGTPERAVTLDQAIGWLARATRLDPANPDLHGRLAQFYLEAGRPADAIQEGIKALLCPQPLDPGYVQVAAEASRRVNRGS